MGHSSIQVTVDLYCHWIPGSNRQAVDRLDELVDHSQTGGKSATIRNETHPQPSRNHSGTRNAGVKIISVPVQHSSPRTHTTRHLFAFRKTVTRNTLCAVTPFQFHL